MRTTKRVIILSNVKSPLIAQAIFILKDDAGDEFHAVAEAERIVDAYMAKACFSKRIRNFSPLIFTVLFAIGVTLALIAANF